MFNNTDEPVLDLKLWKSHDDEFDIDAIQSWGVIERDDREYKLQVVWNDAYDVSIYQDKDVVYVTVLQGQFFRTQDNTAMQDDWEMNRECPTQLVSTWSEIGGTAKNATKVIIIVNLIMNIFLSASL